MASPRPPVRRSRVCTNPPMAVPIAPKLPITGTQNDRIPKTKLAIAHPLVPTGFGGYIPAPGYPPYCGPPPGKGGGGGNPWPYDGATTAGAPTGTTDTDPAAPSI